jgi:hypothetical protein
MDVDGYRKAGRQRSRTTRWPTAGLLVAATLSLTGCLPASANQGGVDIQAPGLTGGVPASAQAPPPPPELPA